MANGLEMVIVGIDPGITGALAALIVLPDECRVSVWDIPTKPRDYGKASEIDGAALANLLRPLAAFNDKVRVCIESQQAHSVGSPATVWSLAHSTGVIVGCLSALAFRFSYVAPAEWKRDLGLSRDKKLSLKRARELYPLAVDLLTRHDRAEALLIAHYAKIKEAGTLEALQAHRTA